MKIQEFMNTAYDNDFDSFDTEYSCTVTICRIEDEDFDRYIAKGDNYYRFAKFIYDNVDVVKSDGSCPTCDFTGFVREYYDVLSKFSDENWRQLYPTQEIMTYQWIREINNFLAGYTSDEMYAELADALEAAQKEKAARTPLSSERLEAILYNALMVLRDEGIYTNQQTLCDELGISEQEAQVLGLEAVLDMEEREL